MIDEKRIQKNLEIFSFPRLYGSDAEKKAFEIAKRKIEDLGIEPNTQDFNFSRFYSIIYPRITFILIFGFLLVLYLNLGGPFQILSILILIGAFMSALI